MGKTHYGNYYPRHSLPHSLVNISSIRWSGEKAHLDRRVMHLVIVIHVEPSSPRNFVIIHDI